MAGIPFSLLPGFTINSNPEGWGPCGPPPTQFKDIPYQPFSKADRLGKAADFTGNAFQTDRYGTQFGGGDAFAYHHEDDDAQFRVVESRVFKPTVNRGGNTRKPFQSSGFRPNFQQRGPPNARQQTSRPAYFPSKNPRFRRSVKPRMPSVEVGNEWKVVDEIEFSKLGKLTYKKVEKKDTLVECGSVGVYEKRYNFMDPSKPRKLEPLEVSWPKVTTTDDPIIRKSVKEADVFGTDVILAALMAAPRSLYSWDIIIQRVNNKIFFDKRDSSTLDFLTVNENANEDAGNEDDAHNSPQRLSWEATLVNQLFSQQTVKKDSVHTFKNPSPFPAQDGAAPLARVGYRYNRFSFDDKFTLLVRCEVDAITENKKFVNTKAFSEWDPRSSDWRKRLNTQAGSVLGEELRNNANKVARWTVAALLAGAEFLRLGYVSRQLGIPGVVEKGPPQHVILGAQEVSTENFAQQIGLSMDNGWAILKHYIDLVSKHGDGKYVVMKDPIKGILRTYAVPEDTFDSDESDEAEEQDEEGEGVEKEAEAA